MLELHYTELLQHSCLNIVFILIIPLWDIITISRFKILFYSSSFPVRNPFSGFVDFLNIHARHIDLNSDRSMCEAADVE